MTDMNAHDLPALLHLVMRDEKASTSSTSHLNYAGRGNIHRGRDAHQATRDALDLLFERAWQRGLGGRTKTSSPATTTPTASTCCNGCASASALAAAPLRASASSPGAATPAA